MALSAIDRNSRIEEGIGLVRLLLLNIDRMLQDLDASFGAEGERAVDTDERLPMLPERISRAYPVLGGGYVGITIALSPPTVTPWRSAEGGWQDVAREAVVRHDESTRLLAEFSTRADVARLADELHLLTGTGVAAEPDPSQLADVTVGDDAAGPPESSPAAAVPMGWTSWDDRKCDELVGVKVAHLAALSARDFRDVFRKTVVQLAGEGVPWPFDTVLPGAKVIWLSKDKSKLPKLPVPDEVPGVGYLYIPGAKDALVKNATVMVTWMLSQDPVVQKKAKGRPILSVLCLPRSAFTVWTGQAGQPGQKLLAVRLSWGAGKEHMFPAAYIKDILLGTVAWLHAEGFRLPDGGEPAQNDAGLLWKPGKNAWILGTDPGATYKTEAVGVPGEQLFVAILLNTADIFKRVRALLSKGTRGGGTWRLKQKVEIEVCWASEAIASSADQTADNGTPTNLEVTS